MWLLFRIIIIKNILLWQRILCRIYKIANLNSSFINRNIRPGSCSDEAICTPDIYPTLIDLAGLPLRPEQHVDGLSLKGVIEEKESLPERPLFWHYPHYSDPGGTPAAIVMFGEYKLIEFFEDMHIELYNLAKDPSESHNLKDEMPEKAEELLNMLHNWQDSINAKMPEVNPDFQPW